MLSQGEGRDGRGDVTWGGEGGGRRCTNIRGVGIWGFRGVGGKGLEGPLRAMAARTGGSACLKDPNNFVSGYCVQRATGSTGRELPSTRLGAKNSLRERRSLGTASATLQEEAALECKSWKRQLEMPSLRTHLQQPERAI